MQFMPGDIIQAHEEPFLKNLNMACKETNCSWCFKTSSDLRRCARCKTVFYCNVDCQKIDWTTAHSIECKLFASSQFVELLTSDGVFQIIKLLAFLKLHPERAKKSYELYNGSSR